MAALSLGDEAFLFKPAQSDRELTKVVSMRADRQFAGTTQRVGGMPVQRRELLFLHRVTSYGVTPHT